MGRLSAYNPKQKQNKDLTTLRMVSDMVYNDGDKYK